MYRFVAKMLTTSGRLDAVQETDKMIRHDEFSVIAIQAMLITPDHSQFSQVNFLAKTLGKFASRYTNVQALALPPEVPADVPRITLESYDKAFEVHASPSRIVSQWTAPSSGHEQTLPLTDCADVLLHYLDSSTVPIRVGRLALIVNWKLVTNDPAQKLISQFCNKQVAEHQFLHSHDFEVHNHMAYELPGFSSMINSWVRCKAVTFTMPEQHRGVLVEQDINTQEGMLTNQFSTAQILPFFAAAYEESQSILVSYFPSEER